jgi:hypothetical protein
VRISSSTPVQLAARQRKVEKETVARQWRYTILGAKPAAIHLTYLPNRWKEVQQAEPSRERILAIFGENSRGRL